MLNLNTKSKFKVLKKYTTKFSEKKIKNFRLRNVFFFIKNCYTLKNLYIFLLKKKSLSYKNNFQKEKNYVLYMFSKNKMQSNNLIFSAFLQKFVFLFKKFYCVFSYRYRFFPLTIFNFVDCFSKTIFINKLVLTFMKNGNKSLCYSNFLNVFSFFFLNYKISVTLLFYRIFYFLKMPVNISFYVKSGRIKYSPILYSLKRQYVFAFLLLKKGVFSRKEFSFLHKFLAEIIDILFQNTGLTLSKLYSTVSVATENKTDIKRRLHRLY
jgi:hypothetical protein